MPVNWQNGLLRYRYHMSMSGLVYAEIDINNTTQSYAIQEAERVMKGDRLWPKYKLCDHCAETFHISQRSWEVDTIESQGVTDEEPGIPAEAKAR